MKKMSHVIMNAALLVVMLALIIDTKTAHEGAVEGLSLCIQSVIPSLFPFIFLSMLLTSSLYGMKIPLLSPLRKLCSMPEGTESILLIAFLGGYPVGAQTVHSAWSKGTLETRTAKRLLGFCNNAGPSFIFGLLGSHFTRNASTWCLWLIHIVSALAVGCILPVSITNSHQSTRPQPMTATAAVRKSIHIMANICGWVMIIRIFLAFATKYVLRYLPPITQVLISGCVELTNGCVSLQFIKEEPIRFIAASFMLSMGGLCVLLQTKAATGELGTGMYLPGKLLQALISIILSSLMLPLLYPIPAQSHCLLLSCVGGSLLIAVMIIMKKVVAFRQNLLYNNASTKRKDQSLCFFAEK